MFCRLSSMRSRSTGTPYIRPAIAEAMAASVGSLAASSAAPAVEFVSSTGTSGRLAASQPRHCASPCGCDSTRLISRSSPARDSRHWPISSVSSPQIFRSDSSSRSRVTLTAPSMEFSTGTTPNWARPRSTSSKMSAIEREAW